MASLIECNSNEEWDEFVETSIHGSIYLKTAFISVLDIHHKKYFLNVDGVNVAAALIIEPNNLDFIAPYPATCYQGIMLAPVKGKQHSVTAKNYRYTSEFIELLTGKFQALEFSLHPNFNDLRPIQWLNYHEQEKGRFSIQLQYSGIISLEHITSFDSYLKSIRILRQREYKKAKKNALKIVESDDIAEFLRLYDLTFARQGITVKSAAYQRVAKIAGLVISSNVGRLTFCQDENYNVHSAMLTLEDRNCTYYEFGASDPVYRNSGASTYLMLENIKYSIEAGKPKFDMVGINSPNRGDYKLSFNASPTPYFIASWRNHNH